MAVTKKQVLDYLGKQGIMLKLCHNPHPISLAEFDKCYGSGAFELKKSPETGELMISSSLGQYIRQQPKGWRPFSSRLTAIAEEDGSWTISSPRPIFSEKQPRDCEGYDFISPFGREIEKRNYSKIRLLRTAHD